MSEHMRWVRRVRDWATLRCTHCGHRFRWKRDARHSFGNRDGIVYHGPCMAAVKWRRAAEERLDVLEVVCDVTGVTSRDVTQVVELRAATHTERAAESNKVFRVFYAAQKRATEPARP